MIEQIDQLEQRLTQFIERHRETRRVMEEQRTSNDQLRKQVSNHAALVEENRVLREKIRTLEDEINSLNDKEDEIRGRLTSILDRISTLESEIQETGRVN